VIAVAWNGQEIPNTKHQHPEKKIQVKLDSSCSIFAFSSHRFHYNECLCNRTAIFLTQRRKATKARRGRRGNKKSRLIKNHLRFQKSWARVGARLDQGPDADAVLHGG
jgi:hypothetical protein